ncbi:MAG: class I SAM-dependent methyltransferase [Candidatus Cloacimonetes bacterium]|nr:class I SAM-dependent methyltransferase [Candidatus Cloacimonadota bacterium]
MENNCNYVCPVWMAYTFDNPLRRLIHNPARMFKDYLKPGMQVLDLGCGMGFFSLAMAKIVGETGKVYAVDLQPGMLKQVRKRAQKRNLQNTIVTQTCQPDKINLTQKVDFALAFWMIHETPDYKAFLRQIYELLNPGGIFFLADPKHHVSKKFFLQAITYAQNAGFRTEASPKVNLSRAMVFLKP